MSHHQHLGATPTDDTDLEEPCDMCELIFPDPRRLFRHLFDFHELSKDQINHYKVNRRRKQVQKKARRKERIMFECEICQKPYLSKLGLVNHKEREHNEVRVIITSNDNIVCPVQGCSTRFITYLDLSDHADIHHRDLVDIPESFRIHRARFPNFEKFTMWKEAKQIETMSRFYTRSTETKVRYARKVWLMKCIHTHRKRSTLYTSDHCPAFIRLCERFNGEHEAVACFGHLGHAHISQNTMLMDHQEFDEEEEEDGLGGRHVQPKLELDVGDMEYVEDELGQEYEYAEEVLVPVGDGTYMAEQMHVSSSGQLQ